MLRALNVTSKTTCNFSSSFLRRKGRKAMQPPKVTGCRHFLICEFCGFRTKKDRRACAHLCGAKAVPCLWKERSEVLSTGIRHITEQIQQMQRLCSVGEEKERCLYVRVCLAASTKVAVREIVC
ncbi:uncharacterized protein M8220_000913 [Acridotheres tristis]